MIGLTIDQAARLTAGAAMWSTVGVPDEGVPAASLADGPMGIASGRIDEREVSRLTPCAVSLGASFDPGLIARVGALVGGEAVRTGVDLVLAPNVNLARSPLAGRAFEYFSEDPLLAGIAGAAWVRGLQSTGTGAVPKHLVCNDSETDRDRVNIVVDERTMREVYLLPFELCAEAGAVAMLCAYNRVNGDWCAESRHVTTIVKHEWGFRGALMSDWFGTHSTAGSLNGGLDLEMPGPARFLGEKALAAIEAGDVSEARVRDAAARVAHTARAATGAKHLPNGDMDALLEEAAAAGMVLLRNRDGLLPLEPSRIRHLALIGPNAASPCYQGGTFAKIAVSPDVVRPLEAIQRRLGHELAIRYEPGVDPQPRLPAMPTVPARDVGDGRHRGMTLDYFADGDLDATPMFSETRDSNSLVWFVGVHDQGVFDRPAGVRASGMLIVEEDGEHLFYLGATGAVRMLLDGAEVLARPERMAASDVMGSLKRGDADSVAVPLKAGQRVHVEIEFRYDGARVHGLWYGLRAPGSAEEMFQRAVDSARDADAVVMVVGETSDSSVESKDRPDTRLPHDQEALIRAVCSANPRTVVVFNVGHAFDATCAGDAAAVVCAWYPGEGFGEALAAVLAGDREPGGRLPVTLARAERDYPALSLAPDARGDLFYSEALAVGYRGMAARAATPLHAFGSGFGYTRFEIVDARISGAGVSVTLRNTGTRRGAEVIQAYRRSPDFALVGFARIELDAGEDGVMDIAIEPRMLRRWTDEGWKPLTGPVPIAIGRASDDLPYALELPVG